MTSERKTDICDVYESVLKFAQFYSRERYRLHLESKQFGSSELSQLLCNWWRCVIDHEHIGLSGSNANDYMNYILDPLQNITTNVDDPNVVMWNKLDVIINSTDFTGDAIDILFNHFNIIDGHNHGNEIAFPSDGKVD